jgi:hypothetical protein
MHTNGSGRNVKWWTELAALEVFVIFGIDGLGDTHSLYRINTNWDKIIENARAFVSAGGRARWDMIVFKHNEHQIELAKQMAKELNFDSFSHKATSRFLEKPWLDVINKEGTVLYKLEPTSEHKMTFIHPDVIKSYKKVVETATIKCKVMQDKSLYIDAFKTLWPCCWIGMLPYLYSKPSDLIHTYQLDQTNTITDLVEYIGGWDSINLTKRPLNEIIDDRRWSTVWQHYWDNKKLATCAKTCGVFTEKVVTQYDEQFIKVESLNE